MSARLRRAVADAVADERKRCAAVARSYPRPVGGGYDPRHHAALHIAEVIESGAAAMPEAQMERWT